jgi:hypothetical protein
MRGVWLHDEPSGKTRNLTDFNSILKHYTKLKRLIIPYVANDKILETVLKHCHNINFLDVSGTSEITDKGVEKL